MYKFLILIPYCFLIYYILKGLKKSTDDYKKIQSIFDKRKWITDKIYLFHKTSLNNGTLTNEMWNQYVSISESDDFYTNITFYNEILIDIYKDYVPEFKKEIRDNKLKNILQ